MGGGARVNLVEYQQQAAAAKERPYDGGFTATSMCDEFDPKKVKTRYSRRGPFNHFDEVITVALFLDVTGSMGDIPKNLLQGNLGSLIADLEKTFLRPNENLQICFAGVGDSLNDQAPLQVAHFESDNRMAHQLQKLWLESKGGANGAESYNLAWWYAANKTHLNYVLDEKRKGILITVGDDNVHPKLTGAEIRNFLDPNYDGGDISNEKLVEAAMEQYEIYHIVVTDGASYCNDTMTVDKQNALVRKWKTLLGENNIILAESDDVAKAISSIIKRHRPPVKPGTEKITKEAWEKKTLSNLTDAQWLEVLSYTVCPLSGGYMKQPGDWYESKKAYEKEYVINYINKNGKDPITQKPITLGKVNFKINSSISMICADYKPYFDVLPEARKTRLIKLALEQIRVGEQPVSNAAVPNRNSDANNANNIPAAALPSASNLPFFERKPVAASSAASFNALSKDSDDVPNVFICPLKLDVMDDPVNAEDGYTYERKKIEAVIAGKLTFMSPMTNTLVASTLTPANVIRSDILAWKERQNKKAEQEKAKKTEPEKIKGAADSPAPLPRP